MKKSKEDVEIFGKRYLKTREAARYMNKAPGSLANERSKGLGPPYCKVGHLCLYDVKDLDEFIQARKIRHG